MKANLKKYTFFFSLLLFAAILLYIAKHLYSHLEPSLFVTEFANLCMTLGGVFILGGFIKYLFDSIQIENEKKDESKQFRIKLLNELRYIADEVALAKILILSHQSAKTYGECMRNKIMPSCISLWEIKRTLVDNEDEFLKEATPHIRARIHSMIAYLKALMLEFEENYIDISKMQKYQEAAYLDSAKKFVSSFTEQTNHEELTGYSNSWKMIKKLHFCNNFIHDERDEGREYEIFFSRHYRACKLLLKRGKKTENEEKVVYKIYEQMRSNSLKTSIDFKKIEIDKYGGDLIKWILQEELNYNIIYPPEETSE